MPRAVTTRPVVYLVAVVTAIVAGCPRADAPLTDEPDASAQSTEPTAITLPPTIELDRPDAIVKRGEAVAGTVRRLSEGTWSLQWRDGGGTLCRRVIEGGADRAFTFTVTYPRMAENHIALCRRAQSISPVARVTFYVDAEPRVRSGYVRIGVPPAGGELDASFPAEAVSWRPRERDAAPDAYGRELAIDLGLETLGGPPGFDAWRAEAGTGSPIRAARVRVPCLSDGAHRAAVTKRIRDALSSPAARTAGVVSLGDGLSPTYRGVPFDFCASMHCAAAFREFLRERYGTLDELGEAWGRTFGGWNEVTPPSLEESGFPTSTDYAMWLDHLAFRDHVFSSWLAAAVAEVRALAPRAAVGYWGASPGTVYGAAEAAAANAAVDWRGRFATGASPYLNELTTHRMAGSLRLGSPGGASGAGAFRSAVGGDLVQRFESGEGDAARACDVLARGLGRLLQLAGPLPPPAVAKGARLRAEVALVHSRASVAASFLVDARASNLPWQRTRAGTTRELDEEDSSWRRVWRAWCRLLRDCGVPYRVMSARDVARGELASKGYRVAVLVRALSLADDEVAELERFARKGGVVVADAGAGLYDGRLKLRRPDALSGLFGVAHADVRFSEAGARREKIATSRFRPGRATPGRDWFPRVTTLGVGPAERGIRPRGARAEGSFGDVPCLLVNPCGGGWGVTLNLALSGYLDVRPLAGGGREVRRLVEGMLHRARVRPAVKMRLEDDVPFRPAIELRALESGTLAIARRDDRGQGDKRPDVGAARARFLVDDGGDGALYDPLRGEYLGRTGEIDVELAGGATRVYAFLPYRLVSMNATPVGVPEDATRDGPERVEITLRREGNEPWCTHVVELTVTGPDGRARADLGRLVEIAGGRAEVVIPFGEGDAQGLWKIRLRDAATGVVAVARLTRWGKSAWRRPPE